MNLSNIKIFVIQLILIGGFWLAFPLITSASCQNTPMGPAAQGSMFGITSGNMFLSTVDITFSPVYSLSTTSGTSGCPNWDFASLLEVERNHFLDFSLKPLLLESAQGSGPHLIALSRLYGCEASLDTQFIETARLYFIEQMDQETSLPSYHNAQLLTYLRRDPRLQNHCRAL